MNDHPDALASVQRGFELFNSGDFDTLFAEVFDPDVSYRGDPDVSALAGFPADAEGAADVRAVWEAFFSAFEEIHLTEVELSASDEETVMGRCHMLSRGGASGTPIDAPFHFAWVVREGRWAFMAAKLDRDQVLAALASWQDADHSSQA